MRRTWVAILAWGAASAVAGLLGTRAASAQQERPTTAAAAPRDADTQPAKAQRRIGTTVPELLASLTDSDAAPPVRQEAARRLVARQTDESRAVVRQVITTPANPSARVEVLRAMAQSSGQDPQLLPDVAALLNGDNDVLVDAAARALAAYRDNPQAMEALTGVASDNRRPRGVRLAATRALAAFIEQPAAATLVRLATTSTDANLVGAATEALLQMTGLESNGTNPQRWDEWHRQNGARPAAEWKALILGARATRDDRLRQRADESANELQEFLREQYVSTPADDKPARLMRYLNSSSADFRRAGARIAEVIPSGAVRGQITPEVQARLIELIGDADPLVRLDVVKALYNINTDPDQALDALLPQLRVERDPEVRAAIARKLSNIPRLRQVSDLVRLLSDDEPAVVREAADAIRRRAPSILEQDQKLALSVSQTLRETIEKRLAGRAGFVEARRACGEALAELKDPANFAFAQGLLNRREPPRIRGVALTILGEQGPRASGLIIDAVDNERDTSVRVEGVAALARTKNFEQSKWLVDKMTGAGIEPEVQAEARKTYVALLPWASVDKLNHEAGLRKSDVPLRVEILKVLIQRLKEAGKEKEEDVAIQQESIGADYLHADVNDPGRAVQPLREALNYWRDKDASKEVTDALVDQLLQALMGDRQYKQVVGLAKELSTDKNNYHQEIFVSIVKQAEYLLEKSPDAPELDHAAALLGAAATIDPPPEPYWQKRIENWRQRLQELQRQRGNERAPR